MKVYLKTGIKKAKIGLIRSIYVRLHPSKVRICWDVSNGIDNSIKTRYKIIKGKIYILGFEVYHEST